VQLLQMVLSGQPLPPPLESQFTGGASQHSSPVPGSGAMPPTALNGGLISSAIAHLSPTAPSAGSAFTLFGTAGETATGVSGFAGRESDSAASRSLPSWKRTMLMRQRPSKQAAVPAAFQSSATRLSGQQRDKRSGTSGTGNGAVATANGNGSVSGVGSGASPSPPPPQSSQRGRSLHRATASPPHLTPSVGMTSLSPASAATGRRAPPAIAEQPGIVLVKVDNSGKRTGAAAVASPA
jgi:hypothetical protein